MPDSTTARRRWLTAVVFLAAAAARILFWQATPDRDWPHSAMYKGDAVTWVEWAGAISSGRPFELALPIRPPGNAYLLAFLGVDGVAGTARAKLVWCLLGALAVTLFFRAALAAFSLPAALLVALWTAFSTALLQFSTSLNNETPYLTLVAAQLLVVGRLAREQDKKSAPARKDLLLWGALNGVACLFRVEHALFFVLTTLFLTTPELGRLRRSAPRRRRTEPSAARRPPWQAPVRRLGWIALAFAAVLAPWHLSAWHEIDRFNHREPRLDGPAEAAQAAVERATAGLEWEPGARTERSRLPAFIRRGAANFVAATVLVRGERRVHQESFAILDEAFGYRPEPISSHPFVTLYGPLNFYLAHNPEAVPGFQRAGLDRPPPLAGGIGRYPRALLAGLPPFDLSFIYPPHLEIVNHGYGLGLRWIRSHPRKFLKRTWSRLEIFWQGAALGWTGRGLPAGLTGVRRAVDLTVPTGGWPAAWRVLLLAACAAGIWRGRRPAAMVPWLLLAATKVAATVLFFGYARHGACCVPVVALLVALAVLGPELRQPAGPRTRVWLTAAALAAVLALGSELVRVLDPPALVLDGQGIENGDPFDVKDHRDRRLEVGIR